MESANFFVVKKVDNSATGKWDGFVWVGKFVCIQNSLKMS